MNSIRPVTRLAAFAKSSPFSNPEAPSPLLPQSLEHFPERRSAKGNPNAPGAFVCQCGRPVFFGNSQCLACHTPLGYDSDAHKLLPLEPVGDDRNAPVVARPGAPVMLLSETGWWRAYAAPAGAQRYRRCSNLDTPAACNWLVAANESRAGEPALCRCCRLTRTLPVLSLPESGSWWNRIEMAKRRLVASLIGLRLPVLSKSEDPKRGLAFDILRAEPGQTPIVTGHADGVITLDLEDADDSWREQRCMALAEPYRTLLGHLRYESGHYYWQRLVANTAWLTSFRAVFGDERQDYSAALQRHSRQGAVPGWSQCFVSAYASSHPREDWAETWAHYLHLVDTLETARSCGLHGAHVEPSYERSGLDVLADAGTPLAAEFLLLINRWIELTGVLNELSRSMGVPDFHPFVLSAPAVRKLYLVHRVIAAAGS